MPRKKKEETTTDSVKTTKKKTETTTDSVKTPSAFSEYGFYALREKAKLNKDMFGAKIR